MKAIAGHYGGADMRSQLEIQWARFFDMVGMAWEYEPKTFRFKDIWYLPDFYLPDQKCWVEVKGVLDNKSRVKIFRLVQEVGKDADVWLATEAPTQVGVSGWHLRLLKTHGRRLTTSMPSRTCVGNCAACQSLVLHVQQKGYKGKCPMCGHTSFTRKYFPRSGERRA